MWCKTVRSCYMIWSGCNSLQKVSSFTNLRRIQLAIIILVFLLVFMIWVCFNSDLRNVALHLLKLCFHVSGGAGSMGYCRARGLWPASSTFLPRHWRHSYVLLYWQSRQFRWLCPLFLSLQWCSEINIINMLSFIGKKYCLFINKCVNGEVSDLFSKSSCLRGPFNVTGLNKSFTYWQCSVFHPSKWSPHFS